MRGKILKILLCNDSYPRAVEKLNELLPEHQVISCSTGAVADFIQGVDVVIPSVARIDSTLIKKGTFGLIQQLGIGLDSVDIDAATEYGVWVARVPGAGSGNAESVAELAMLFILALARRLDEARKNVADGVFFKPTGRSLLGKTVCIVGMGDIGTALAEWLTPFGVRLKGVRRRPELGAPKHLQFDAIHGTKELSQALADSDFVVLALPETQESRNLIDAAAIEQMKTGVGLINVGRGGLIDDAALLQGLRSGKIGGAGLDVFRNEPTDPKDPLFKENVIATPHIGGNTDASFTGIINAIAANIRRYAAGETPHDIVNSPLRPRRFGL